ncbi:M16 family metallopeptidase [Melittangium boletus]|uniref:Putative Zn-dependent peptidase n=1 Tax=Melittangium boletus DSM 14713 TaxID=1294270 RepID=A0A250ICD2_9BACT|nr:pitrilysin family protein [Melittangium boletus]ATB28797.1 putative Zn-dependent peptidase [Melittangium boletus DSM 14713]
MFPSPWPPGLLLLLLGASVSAAPALHVERLDNGLEVVVVERHDVPLVTVELAVRAGAQVEGPEDNGLSHLCEHLLALPDSSRELPWPPGVRYKAFTSVEVVDLHFTATPELLEGGLTVLRERLRSPGLSPEDVKRESAAVLKEMELVASRPDDALFRAKLGRLWWKHSSYKDQLGTRRAVSEATPERLQRLLGRYFVPNNSLLVISGDVGTGDALALVRRVFSGWKRQPEPFEAFPPVVHPPLPGREVVFVRRPVDKVSGGFDWHGPSAMGAGAELAPAARLLGALTSAGSSPFQRAVVGSGACVSARFGWYPQRNVGPLELSFEAAPERVDDCVRAVLAELGRWKTQGFSEEALGEGVRQLAIEQAYTRERPSSFARDISLGWSVADVPTYLSSLEDARRVRPEEMARLLDTYVLGQPHVFSVMVPEAEAWRRLDEAHFTRLLDEAVTR